MTKHVIIFLLFCIVFTTVISAQIRYTVIPDYPLPGEPVTIGVNSPAQQAVLFVNGIRLASSRVFSVPGTDSALSFFVTVLTIPSTVMPGGAIIRLNNENGVLCEIPIIIAPRDFVSEVIELDPVLTGIRTDSSTQRTEEANRLWAILSTTGNQIYHSGTFIPPVTSTRRTSFFGDHRVYRYSNGTSDTSIHAGVDFGVPTGTQVVACGSGRVALARMRIVTGNSVVIEHAPGVYSLYYHLDKIEVQEGAIVEAGTLLGLSGATGLATGPHLHWEVRVSTENTDPDAFVSRPIIDKNLIISRIYN
ncbi:MAG: M23 family metallopeptidase [Treponema sp.]|nr:M23 family metallopeptidase [Treponema sp.]